MTKAAKADVFRCHPVNTPITSHLTMIKFDQVPNYDRLYSSILKSFVVLYILFTTQCVYCKAYVNSTLCKLPCPYPVLN